MVICYKYFEIISFRLLIFVMINLCFNSGFLSYVFIKKLSSNNNFFTDAAINGINFKTIHANGKVFNINSKIIAG